MARDYEFPAFVNDTLGNTPTTQAEALVHELCHAAVFRMRALPLETLAERIGDRFLQYTELLASDLSECRALAVEHIVFKALDWWLPWKPIVKLAADDMWVFTLTEAHNAIERFETTRQAADRAAQVIRWLKPYAEKESG